MQTRQDAAINAANTLIGITAQFRDLRATVNDFVTQYNKEAYGTTWANLPTKAQNADGSLGASDGSPVASNPINISALNKAVSANMLTNAVVMLQAFQNFLSNQAVSTGDRNQTIDDLAS